jgi:hypothetical protein
MAQVPAAMDKKGRTSMVNKRLRQNAAPFPRRITIDSAGHMGMRLVEVLPNAAKRPNVAHRFKGFPAALPPESRIL